jgi:hypothetical protein
MIVMKKQIAALVLAGSVVGGIVAGVTVDALTSERPTRAAPARATTPAPVDVPDVEVKDPVLVMNDDGTATLSATLINHLEKPLEINSATNGQVEDLDAPPMLVHGIRLHTPLIRDEPMRIGGVGDAYRLRLSDRAQVGSTLPITLRVTEHEGYDPEIPKVSFLAPVVARTAAHADVANNGPNPSISVRDAIIVVVPGQAKAYVGGTIESTIEDMTELRPTVRPRLGQSIELLHQTATGGPSGFFAQVGTSSLGDPPYLDSDIPGDRDYVRASEVKIGQTITMTFRFPSGDVVARFKVVRGNPDGTVA